MGEILRAIMDFNCLDSRVAFYSAQLISAAPATGVATITGRTATIPCKQDTYFLAMGASFDSAFIQPGVAYDWNAKAAPLTFDIARANSREPFATSPLQQVLQNYNLNNWVTWDEYVLFQPAELILVNADIITTTIASGAAQYSFVTLMGVEYRMKNEG